MFQTLFQYPRVLARHRDGPAAPERELFLQYCASTGSTRASLLHLASELLLVSHKIDISGKRLIDPQEIDIASEHWAHNQLDQMRILDPKYCRRWFVETATSWLRFLGQLAPPPAQHLPFADLIDEFAAYMRDERGLSPRTIKNRCWHVQAFACWLEEQGLSLPKAKLEQIDGFLALKGEQGWCRVSVATVADALRSFFKRLAVQGRCSLRLADAIRGPRLFAQENLPVGPKWEDVRRLVSSTATDIPQDIRDRAILLLLAVYGLRAGEVVTLMLDDVDWERGILHVGRPKQRCKQDYPLAGDVGEAILHYLQIVRPRCSLRWLFLTLRAPLRPIAPCSLHSMVEKRMAALDIKSHKHGPHSLRHACATHLVAEGLSFKEIGDHLGHRSPAATRTYAKVDLAGLREVAAFDLGGLK
jgi:integrase/recombinase XerD